MWLWLVWWRSSRDGVGACITNSANVIDSGQSDVSSLAPGCSPAEFYTVVLVSASNEQSSKTQVSAAAVEDARSVAGEVLTVDCNGNGSSGECAFEIAAFVHIGEAFNFEQAWAELARADNSGPRISALGLNSYMKKDIPLEAMYW